MNRALLLLAAAALPMLAQSLNSPEVHPDRTVTFRFLAPNAKDVALNLEGAPKAAMQKDAQGVWSFTTPPLEPDLYAYTVTVDGARVLDPANPLLKGNLRQSENIVHVPGPASTPWEINDVPRGAIHRHFYRSTVVGDQRDFYVYTPPGYDPSRRERFPVLYLLHGFSDDASAWVATGRAHVILDNLIAQGKARPMLVVMPLGYGAPEIVARTPGAARDLGQRNIEKFSEALRTEVIPQVEKAYRVAADRESRAIVGLSMGGAESLYTGLNNLNLFAWVGAFSAGMLRQDLEQAFPGLDAKANARLRLLWIGCGKEDRLLQSNQTLVQWLNSRGIQRTWVESPGAHTWMVWRRNLSDLAPLLFQKKTP